MPDQWNHKIFDVDPARFTGLALEIFRFQSQENKVYKSFIDALKIDPGRVKKISQIPFLPIRFFKTHAIQSTTFEPKLVFESSGTTGMVNSKHLVKDPDLYEESFIKGFKRQYGEIDEWCILGLLPSYLERQNSSLIYMVNRLIQLSGHPESGFYLNQFGELAEKLQKNESKGTRTLLIGVSFALLDFAQLHPLKLNHTVVIETGGMKGRRKELIREDLHHQLKKAFQVEQVHSEYGMTELLSQAYSPGEGKFIVPPWMKIILRDEEDPFNLVENGRGIINVIDLANIYSCAFIATDDAGKLSTDGRFEVTGRIDGSDIRGCSLMSFDQAS